jgi:hypothetical protein
MAASDNAEFDVHQTDPARLKEKNMSTIDKLNAEVGRRLSRLAKKIVHSDLRFEVRQDSEGSKLFSIYQGGKEIRGGFRTLDEAVSQGREWAKQKKI